MFVCVVCACVCGMHTHVWVCRSHVSSCHCPPDFLRQGLLLELTYWLDWLARESLGGLSPLPLCAGVGSVYHT